MMTKVFSMRLGMVACALLTLGACVKEQSSLSVEDIPGRATITGQLTYSKGQEFTGGKFREITAPAAGVTVYADIENSGYKDGASGFTTLTTVTDNGGNYEFSVPATSSGVHVTIRANDFIGTNKRVTGFEDNGNVKIEEFDGIYTLDDETFSVRPGEIYNYTERYDFLKNNTPVNFTGYAPFKVRVGVGKMRKVTSGSQQSIQYVYSTPDENVNLLLNVNYSNGEEWTYGVTASRSNGTASIDIPVYESKCLLNITVTAMPYLKNNWIEYQYQSYNNYNLISHNGIVEQYNSGFGRKEQYSVSVTGLEGVESIINAHMLFRGFNDSFNNPYLWNNADFEID